VRCEGVEYVVGWGYDEAGITCCMDAALRTVGEEVV
jgi:hypothetical protein